MLKRVLSYSLYGTHLKYLDGAVCNARRVGHYYPGWVARFYIGKSVPGEIIRQLVSHGAEVVRVGEVENALAMLWRFRVFADPEVELALCRDADSRLSNREVAAVGEWLDSGKGFHIMRDHPGHHCEILGGMWGARVDAFRRHHIDIINLLDGKPYQPKYGVDQHVLGDRLYPLIRQDVCVHASFCKYERGARDFPTRREGLHFVGEVFDEHGLPCSMARHILRRCAGRLGWLWNRYYRFLGAYRKIQSHIIGRIRRFYSPRQNSLRLRH